MTLHGLVGASAAARPHAPAVVCGAEMLSYADLWERAGRLAGRLRAAGVGNDDVVGVSCERRPSLVVAMLGVLRAGAAYLPLPADLPAERVGLLLADSGASAVVSSARLRDRVAGSTCPVVTLEGSPTDEDAPLPDVPGRGAAYVIYTSGSTGAPKGVVVEHEAAAAHLRAVVDELGLTPDDVVLQFAGHGFDVAVEQLLAALAAGSRVVLRGDRLWGPSELCRTLVEHRVTVADLPTVLFSELTTERHADTLRGAIASVRAVLVGGEALPAPSLTRWWEVLGASAPPVWNAYGPTETVMTASMHRFDGPATDDAGVPIGAALGPRSLTVLDPDLATVDGPGELYIGGTALARGYLGRPDRTAERFVPDPWGAPGGRMYRTGDRVRSAGTHGVTFLGRVDDQLKVHGHRIEPGEVEARLVEHPAIAQAAVVTTDGRLVACLVGTGTDNPPLAEVPAWLAERLPAWMVPGQWLYLDQLPLTPAGKVDRRGLTAAAAAHRAESRRAEAKRVETPAAGAPDSPLIRQVRGVFEAVLDLPYVDPTVPFLDLGGTSLLAARVQADLRTALGAEVPLHWLIANPTAQTLAERIEAGTDPDVVALPPLTRHDGPRDIAPLSAMQEQIWYLEQLTPGNTAYNAPTTIRLTGPVDPEVLRRALDEMVRRHEILRTSFAVRDGEPVQVIHEPFTVELDTRDLRGEADPYATAEGIVAEEIRRAFDVTRLPLLRWTLLRLADQEYEVVLVEHHIIHDGWSFALLMDELLTNYAAAAGWRPPPAEPDLQYADFAHWQRANLAGPAMDRRREFWARNLAGAPDQLALPYDRARRPGDDAPGASHRIELPADVCAAVRAYGRRHGATLFNTMLGAYAALLRRYTGQDEMCIGSAYGNRAVPGTENVLGMFVNPAVLRCTVPGGQEFRHLVEALRSVLADAQAHQELPFMHLVRDLAPPRRPGHNPLFAAMLNVDDAPLVPLKAGPITATYLERHNGTAKLDLSVLVVPRAERQIGVPAAERDQRITMMWEYRADLFDRSTIARLADSYVALLRAAVADPTLRVDELPLSGADPVVPELFARRVAAAPSAPALRYPGEPWLTYRELDRRANRVANALRATGVGAEDIVGICLPRSVDFVVSVLGVLKSGAAFLPLDPDSPPDRIAGLLADARPRALITDRAAAPAGVTRLTPADAARADDTDPGAAIDPDHLAYLIYTSGSTGRPKAVAVTHRSLVRKYRSWETAYGLDAHPGTHLQAAAVAFDVCVGDLVRALLSGGRLVLCPPDAVPDPAALLDVIRDNGVDTVELLPSVLNLLAAHLTETGDRLESLRLAAVGGEAWTGTDLRRFRAVLGDTTRLLNVYGVTEATIGNTLLDLPAGAAVGETLPVGHALPDVTAVVLDPAGRPTPPGAIGEIFLGGVGLARGYHGRPDLTAQRFVPDPVVPGARLYRTGDRAKYRVDGGIEFLGRSDAQVKIRGFRVEPGEVEAALLALPGVREAAVLAHPDPAGARLVAYVSGVPSTVDVRELLRDALPGYLVPSSVQVLPALPRTSSGKVDRRALPAPVAAASARSRPPAPGLEQEVAAVWREILDADTVAADDDFFDLGGHSLLAARVTARLTAVCGVRIAVRELLAEPTVAAVAARIAELRTTTASTGPALVPRARRAHLVEAGAFDDSGALS